MSPEQIYYLINKYNVSSIVIQNYLCQEVNKLRDRNQANNNAYWSESIKDNMFGLYEPIYGLKCWRTKQFKLDDLESILIKISMLKTFS